jgi:predicted phosphoribosyltransferase
MFIDRIDAARKLAHALAGYRGSNPLVLAIPRGAVPMATLIATELGGEVDVVLVRKLPAPGSPEFAIGAVDETGWTYLTDHAGRMGIDERYIEQERAHQVALMRRRRAQYTPVRPPVDPAERVVIVVDDGLATGSTMIAALHAIRARGPRKLICAVPVAPPETVERVRRDCDEVVCLETPLDFYSVGQFYRSFPQVDDDEVIALLGDR